MDPVSNVDRIVLLLRQKLEERNRTERRAGRSGASVSSSRPTSIAALAAIEGIDERQLRRTLIQTLLAGQLREDLVNDAQFQQVVSRVADAIEEDEAASGLLSRVLADIRAC